MFAVTIEMPSGMQSRPREFQELDEATKLAKSYAEQMVAWTNFEAWVIIFEDGREVGRDHIKNGNRETRRT